MSRRTSRERMLCALDLEDGCVPCCFMSFSTLRQRYGEDRYEAAKAELAMGLDAMLFIPSSSRGQRPEHPDLRGLPVRFESHVETVERREEGPQSGAVLHREYITPAGRLAVRVRLSEDWPHGNRIPFVDDYQIPRVIHPLIGGPQDLDALQYLLTSPNDEDTAQFQSEARIAHGFAREHGVLLAGGWGIGVDMASWLCGMENWMVLTMFQPDFADILLEMIHVWNVGRMRTVLSAPVDLYIRRAWYEGCDFITPSFYRRSVLPRLKTEVDLAHEYGAKFGYICSSGTMPMLDFYLEAGIDVLIGVDPVQGTYMHMPTLKEKLGGQMCLWGGVSGAVTVEMGTEDEVRSAVRHAVAVLGPAGLILSPIDNITVDSPRTWRNVNALIDEWQKLTLHNS